MDEEKIGDIPRGIEVLVKKASVDPDFKTLLLDRRAEAAEAIGLSLTLAEEKMLAAIPREQLEATIAKTTVPTEHRRAFLGTAAAVMLAALGVLAPGCKPTTKGISPDKPEPRPGTKGIQPDRPEPRPGTKGSRPDMPPSAGKGGSR